MSVICRMKGHESVPRVLRNGTMEFSRCRRCGTDLVRREGRDWKVPQRYRIVWPDNVSWDDEQHAPAMGAGDESVPGPSLVQAFGRRLTSIRPGSAPGLALPESPVLAETPTPPKAPVKTEAGNPAQAAAQPEAKVRPEARARRARPARRPASPWEGEADRRKAPPTSLPIMEVLKRLQPLPGFEDPQPAPEPVAQAPAAPPAPQQRRAARPASAASERIDSDFMSDEGSDLFAWDQIAFRGTVNDRRRMGRPENPTPDRRRTPRLLKWI